MPGVTPFADLLCGLCELCGRLPFIASRFTAASPAGLLTENPRGAALDHTPLHHSPPWSPNRRS